MENHNEWHAFIIKYGAAMMSALVATMAKISHEILQGRKLSWVSWLAIVGVSLFWAWMAGLFCSWQGYSTVQSSLVVGLATLLGEKISIYVSQNYKKIFNAIIATKK